ncbi:MAG: phosphoenolpyruvate--protein phosphotransferase, partial [Kangiellaceae bacterium]|nr:phosphoenolpyruvate--protein phosphotransferase [Kangiellaceae bacterium]
SSHSARLIALAAANGIAIGRAKVFYPPADLASVPDKPVRSTKAEISRFKKAVAATIVDIKTMKTSMSHSLASEELTLFDAYIQMASDQSLIDEVSAEIAAGQWAPSALRRVIERHVRAFEALADSYFRERSTDLVDIARRILSHLENSAQVRPKLSKPSILVAEEITASMLAEVPLDKVLGMVSMRGSSTSHAAILAKALGIPAVSGLEDECSDAIPIHQFEGKQLALDGYQGILYISPSDALIKQYRDLTREEKRLSRELIKEVKQPAVTLDGQSIEIHLNTGLLADFEPNVVEQVDGVGLYRTEIPFLLREYFPSEEEQIKIYRSVQNVYQSKPVNFRTLDIGGDKQLSYFPINESNPSLGWRGVRITLDHPEIFLVQVRAILIASLNVDNLKISLPMVSSVDEMDDATRLIRQAHFEICQEYPADQLTMPDIGLILEVPSSIYLLPELLKRVDFVSVGSNDLIQYLLAVDRNNSRVSSLFSHFHPSLLRALRDIVVRCKENNKPVYLCGEMAGDPMAALLLLAMGFNGLSMSANSIGKVKKVIRSFTFSESKIILETLMNYEKANLIKDYLSGIFEQKGLGGLIRAGR